MHDGRLGSSWVVSALTALSVMYPGRVFIAGAALDLLSEHPVCHFFFPSDFAASSFRAAG